MKNQLFRNIPDLKSINQVIQCFGLEDINDNHSFTKENLIDLKTVSHMDEIIDELKKYYLPCKIKYITDINEKKCIKQKFWHSFFYTFSFNWNLASCKQ